MKKTSILFLLMALCCHQSMQAQSQDTIEVASDYNSTCNHPIYPYYTDITYRTEILYPESYLSELAGNQVLQLTFHLDDSTYNFAFTNTFHVYVMSFDSADFASEAWNLTGEAQEVYTGDGEFVDGKIDIILDQPFSYDGGDLLLRIEFPQNGSNYGSSTVHYRGVSTSFPSMISGWNTSWLVTFHPFNFIPWTSFIVSESGTETQVCRRVTNLTLASCTTTSATITWDGMDEHTYGYAVTLPDSTIVVVSDTSYTLTDLQPLTDYQVSVRGICGVGDTSLPRPITFRTPNTPYEGLPIVFDFEDSTDYHYWQILNGGNGWHFGNAVSNGGNSSLYISNDGGNTNIYSNTNRAVSYAILTVQVEQEGNYLCAFDWRAGGESTYDYLRAWIVAGGVNFAADTLPDGSTASGNYYSQTPQGYTDLADGKLNLSQDGWNTIEATVSLTEGIYSIILMWANDGSGGVNPPAAVDNFFFGVEGCPSPSNLRLVEASQTELQVSWHPRGEESSWKISIDGSDAITVTDTTYTFTDLEPSSEYSITVVAVCSEESRPTTASFRTECSMVSHEELPYVENFNSYISSGSMNPCWKKINYSSDNNTPYPYGSYDHNGSGNSLYFYTGSTPQTPTYAITEVFEDVTDLSIRFYLYSYSYGSVTMTVGVMSDPEDTSTFEAIETYSLNDNQWHEFTCSLSEVSLQDARIAFRAQTTDNVQHSIYLDDVTIDLSENIDNPIDPQPDVCNVPTGVHSTAATTSSITLDWGGTAASWKVSVNNGADQAVSSHPYTITGLTAGTTYSIRVKAVCDDGQESAYSNAISVSTDDNTEPQPEVCDVPTNVRSTAATTTSITLDWGGTAASWKVSVNNGTDQAVSSHPYTITGLTANTTYSIRVKAVCDGGQESDYSAAINASTEAEQEEPEPVGIDGVAYSALSLYPNPASGAVSISGIEAGAQVSIVDINGRTLRTLTAQSSTIEMNLEGLVAGTYFVRIAGAEGTTTSRLVVR